MEITLPSYAKINLSLDILRKRPDGYHDMQMVMETLALHDDVTIRISDGDRISARTNWAFLPAGVENIAAKAVKLFFETQNIPPHSVDIFIRKLIPIAAGLAGGSGNAAAVLSGLNILLGTGLSDGALAAMGEALGADVPYCVLRGTMLAEGIGERLTPLPALPPVYVVLAKPGFSIKTPTLFAQVDCAKIRRRPDTPGLIHALERGDLHGVAMRMYNVFEDVLGKQEREIVRIKQTLIDHDALGAVMTGTGSAVFGLFEREADAKRAYLALRENFAETFLTTNLV